MKKFSAVDWQSFSMKKDIEKIRKSLQITKTVQLSILGEIALVVLSAALSNLFVTPESLRKFWVVVIICSLIPLVAPLGLWLYKKHENQRPGSNLIKPRDFIDVFDNEICYFILIAESYYSMLVETITEVDIHTEVKRFYFIEASYYANKAVSSLGPIAHIAKEVLTLRKDDVVEKRLISIARYNNVVTLLEAIYAYLEERVTVLDVLENKDLIIDNNHDSLSRLKDIKKSVVSLVIANNNPRPIQPATFRRE